jgi:hypothetical protein
MAKWETVEDIEADLRAAAEAARLARQKPKPPEVRRVAHDPEPKPLLGPWQRWRKPLPAIIADATANSRAVLARLDRGLRVPEENSRYREALNDLYRRTVDQIKALEVFSAIDWRE